MDRVFGIRALRYWVIITRLSTPNKCQPYKGCQDHMNSELSKQINNYSYIMQQDLIFKFTSVQMRSNISQCMQQEFARLLARYQQPNSSKTLTNRISWVKRIPRQQADEYLKAIEASPPSPSPSPSLGGEEFMSRTGFLLDLNPRGQRPLFTPLSVHCPHTHSSPSISSRPHIPVQPRWNPSSQPSQTTTLSLSSAGRPHAPQAEVPGARTGAAGGSGGRSGTSW